MSDLLGKYKLVLGLEIHLHLKTARKMFCRCDANIYGAEPNTHTCPVCLGLPGALPVPNLEAIKKTQLLGLALNTRLNENSRFDRKHYSYPDLPKGYQISQYKQPLCENGWLELASGEKIEIERVHLEEDTAKSFHVGGKTMIDFNKSGMPLVEIVTKPVFKAVEGASEFSRMIQDIVRTLSIGDADMEKGQMRLEANISLRTAEMEQKNQLPSYKVEIKNINSFKFMEKAVLAEIKRQKKELESGKTPIQENRGYDEDKNETVSQRSKEEAHDYRYFPEPDIPPMVFTQEDFDLLKEMLSETPETARKRLVEQYGISEKNARSLTTGVGLGLLKKFEELAMQNLDPEKVANILINKPDKRNLSAEEFAEILKDSESRLEDKKELREIIKQAFDANANAVEDYKKGKHESAEYLLGQVMKATKGKADVDMTRELIIETLSQID